MDCSPLVSSIHGIFQATILEWVDISFSRGVFPIRVSNPYLLHWQTDALPLRGPRRALEGSCCSVAMSCPMLSNPMNCSMPNFLVLHYLPEFAQNHVYWASDAIQPSHTLSSVLFPSIFPGIRVFSNESAICIRWSKYWSFIISPSNEYLGWISFRIDWFDLFALQGTLKSLLQHNSSKASILQCSAQLQHSILCDQTLTSTHDYWKTCSFDYTDLWQQSDVSSL